MLDQNHLEQNHRIDTWPSGVFTVQLFYYLVQLVKIYGIVYLS